MWPSNHTLKHLPKINENSSYKTLHRSLVIIVLNWSWGYTQLLICGLCKHEDLSSILSTHLTGPVWQHTPLLSPWKRQTHWPVRVDRSVSPRPQWQSCLGKQGGCQYLRLNSDLHTHVHICASEHTHTHSPQTGNKCLY